MIEFFVHRMYVWSLTTWKMRLDFPVMLRDCTNHAKNTKISAVYCRFRILFFFTEELNLYNDSSQRELKKIIKNKEVDCTETIFFTSVFLHKFAGILCYFVIWGSSFNQVFSQLFHSRPTSICFILNSYF